MDGYKAIYDAVRSRIGNSDIGEAVQQAMREANISHYVEQAAEAWRCAAAEHARPCAVFRPRIYIDGNQWCALYGENLQDGVSGFGDSPATAMHEFDRAWTARLNP